MGIDLIFDLSFVVTSQASLLLKGALAGLDIKNMFMLFILPGPDAFIIGGNKLDK
jgi:hypothetical protein